MPTKNTEKEFGTISKTLHWLVLAIVIVLIAIASKSGDLPRGEEKLELVLLHASFGLLLLSVLAARLVWRWSNITPARMPHIPTWQHITSRAVHYGLYISGGYAVCPGPERDGPVCDGRLQGTVLRNVRSGVSNG